MYLVQVTTTLRRGVLEILVCIKRSARVTGLAREKAHKVQQLLFFFLLKLVLSTSN